MTSATFDTLKAVKALTATGFDARQAEAVTDTVRDAMSEGVATRADIAGLEAGIAELEATILLAIFGAAGALFAALKPFPGGAP